MARGSRDTDLTAYLPPAEALEKRPLPVLARSVLYLLLLFLALAVIWGTISKVDRVVTAQGRLVASVPDVIVNPLENSILRELHVRPGDRVQAGQVIATFDPTFSQADLASLEKRLAVVRAQLARLDAELAGSSYQGLDCPNESLVGGASPMLHQKMSFEVAEATMPFPDALPIQPDGLPIQPDGLPIQSNECAAELLQREIFVRRQRAYEARTATFAESLAAIAAKRATTEAMLAGVGARLDLEKEIVGMYSALSKSKVTSKRKLLESRRELVRLRIDEMRLSGQQAQERQQARQIVADRQAFVDEWVLAIVTEQLKLQNELVPLEENLSKARLKSDLVELKAPIDGTVLELAKGLSVGSVVAEVQPIATLSATDASLELEVEVPARDIGRIRVGDQVRIKVEAFPFQRHGTIDGVLRTVSADAFSRLAEKGGGSYFRARVNLGVVNLKDVPPDMRLSSGMNVSAELVVGDRTVISYFLYPIFRGLDEAIREP